MLLLRMLCETPDLVVAAIVVIVILILWYYYDKDCSKSEGFGPTQLIPYRFADLRKNKRFTEGILPKINSLRRPLLKNYPIPFMSMPTSWMEPDKYHFRFAEVANYIRELNKSPFVAFMVLFETNLINKKETYDDLLNFVIYSYSRSPSFLYPPRIGGLNIDRSFYECIVNIRAIEKYKVLRDSAKKVDDEPIFLLPGTL